MAKRSSARSSTASTNKTLVGAMIGLVLAALAGLGIQLPGWLTGKAPPTRAEHRTTARPAGLPDTAQSFETAKKWLYDKVYHDHPKTFYCGCDYARAPGQPGAINLRSCGVTARQDPARAQRLEAEHVFPAAKFGNFRPCWREPERFSECVNDNGQTLTGRQCCEKVDPVFEAAHNDLYNLFLAEGEINGDRKSHHRAD